MWILLRLWMGLKSSNMIKIAYELLKKDFESDHVKLKKYIEQRLGSNNIKCIVTLSAFQC